MPKPIITLMTDFGTRDAFTGTMKGVILGILPDACIVDLTHEIFPMNILGGAFVLKTAYSYFPENTVHICVVDPGVGTSRNPIAIRAHGQYFVGPDNGLFGYVLHDAPECECVVIDSRKHCLPGCSSTFHGRDIFAPVGARIAGGMPLHQIGAPLENPILPDGLFAEICEDCIKGRVIHIDHFGNAITNVTRRHISEWRKDTGMSIFLDGVEIPGPFRTYADVPPGGPLALFGSENHLEISVNKGSAEKQLGIEIGVQVLVRTAPSR